MKKNKIKKAEPFQAPSWMRKKDRIKTAEIISYTKREAKRIFGESDTLADTSLLSVAEEVPVVTYNDAKEELTE